LHEIAMHHYKTILSILCFKVFHNSLLSQIRESIELIINIY